MPYALQTIIKLLPADTGLALKAQLVNGSDGSNNGAEISTGFTELGGGEYAWHHPSFPDGFRGYALIISGASTFQTAFAVNPEDAEDIAGLNDLSAADIDARLLAYDAPTKAELDASTSSLSNSVNNLAGAGFNPVTDSLEQIRDNLPLNAPSAAQVRAEIDANSTQLAAIKAKTDTITNAGGDGDTAVNHNTGGVDNLRAADAAGNGLDGVTLRAYLKTEFDANATTATLRATAVTGADGRWTTPMMLDSGLVYTLIFSRPDLMTVAQEVTVP